MKWHHSLITKVSLIFALALLGIGAVFISLSEHEKNKDLGQMLDFSHIALRSAFDANTKSIDTSKLEELGFSIIEDETVRKSVLSQPNRNKPMPLKHMQERMRLSIDTVAFGTSIYTILRKKEGEILVLKTPFEKELFPRILFPLLVFSALIALYIGVIRSLIPLKKLRHQIKAFADGDYEITCKSTKKDEIAALANEFDAAVHKIKSLRDARQLFLRNIMHELKTPITKGKLAAEMIEEGSYTTILRNAFKRQEALLEEFTRIEKLSADELKLELKPYRLQDVVDFALDILEDKREHITCNLTPITLNVDFELFGVALKNLLDNGVTYALDAKVHMQNDAHSITISNHGAALEFELERYGEPYFLEGKKQKNSRGLGFGLFITWHVIRLHGMKIAYVRKDEVNHLTISF
ncbi:MAG: histidine kinase [Sulfurovum sp. FS06-10]|nr:MAG: histidine kinase [Sulfurovum sp. FS06-10]